MTTPTALAQDRPTSETLRVLIADADPDSRVDSRKVLQRAGCAIAGETGYGTEVVSTALLASPDAILVAVEEPTGRALGSVEALVDALPKTPVLIYSSLDDVASVRRCMATGARDFLPRPLEPEATRRAIARAIELELRREKRRSGAIEADPGRATVVTVTGAKGGVGKSVLAVNLALALRRETDKSVVIVDTDTEFGDVITMLNLTPDRSAGDLLKHLDTVDHLTIREFALTHPSGVDVIGTAPDEEAWQETPPEALRKVIDLLARVYEYVVIDAAGPFDPFLRAGIEASTLTLMVTSSEVSSIRDTAAGLRRFEHWGIDPGGVRLVLNHISKPNGVSAADVAQSVAREVFWELPYDRSVPSSVQLGAPVALADRRSPVAASISLLARRIAGIDTAATRKAATNPFWKRVFAGRTA